MSISIPKIFISYSWSSVDRVIELAERLMNDGVDIVLDKWELKEGQDKYTFMERCVTDNTISKVLIICDRQYAEKANNREGGVGDETMVISPEVYAKATETKYIPIIFERDENEQEYKPAYLKARIHIDLSSDEIYEKNYESLLRNLHNKPEYSKPLLGKIPEYLNEETVSLSNIRGSVKQIRAFDGKNHTKLRHIIKNFNDNFIHSLIEFTPVDDNNFDNNLLKQIDAAKPLRDIFLDYVEAIILGDYDVGTVLGDFFEQTYNRVYRIEGRNSYRDSEFEFGLFLIWEMLIGATAILLHFECYKELRSMLNRTYFLYDNPVAMNPKPESFTQFRPSFNYIEMNIKPHLKGEDAQLYTLAGNIAAKREKLPILNTRAIANADVVLYQLSEAIDVKGLHSWQWFPLLYVYLGMGYSGGTQQIWSKMVSLRHCESLYPLFDVDSIDKLKKVVARNKSESNMGYRSGVRSVPTITQSIKLENIATLP